MLGLNYSYTTDSEKTDNPIFGVGEFIEIFYYGNRN